MKILLFLLLGGVLRVHGEVIQNAADSLGFYLLESTLSEDELGLSILESAYRSPRMKKSSLSSLVHSIHHRAALLRQKESRVAEPLIRQEDRSTLLSMQYPDPQYLGISCDSSGIPRSLVSAFTHHILSHLVPYKDFLIGVKKSCSSSSLFKGRPFQPELFHSILPNIASSLSEKKEIKDVLSLVILSRGNYSSPSLNASLLSDMKRAIAPNRLLVHVFGYMPSTQAEMAMRALGDTYHTIRSEEDLPHGRSFLYRRYLSSSSSVKIIVPPTGNMVTFAHLVDDGETALGLRVPKSYLFSEVYAYNSDDSSVYLFEKSGRLLYQPSREDINSEPLFRHRVRKTMLKEQGGKVPGRQVTFSWKRVDTTPFIVLMAKHSLPPEEDNVLLSVVSNNNTGDTKTPLEYHKKLETKLCRHFRSPANTDTGSLFLSGLAFKDPLNRPRQSDFMNYLNDASSHNPGLRDGLKEEVLLVASITPFWKAKAFDSGLNNYIVRRYVATLSGILYVYPGIRFPNDDMDPKMQDWFLKASAFPGQVTLSSPRLDPGGAGFIVTLSRSLSPVLRSPPTVLALDMTLGYLHKVLVNTLPLCKEPHQRCFIFDQQGYIIVHPRLLRGGMSQGARKENHLTHFEPQIINDLLAYRHFVQKTICASRSDETLVHKRYEFNQSYSSVITSLPRCNSFNISPIPRSNLFLGVVNGSSCAEGSSINFCPCNVEGDTCIICGSLEQMECECPCSCTESCHGQLPACEEEPEGMNPAPVDLDYLSDLPECLTRECGSRTREEDCLGVLGCSWCQEKLLYDDSNWVDLRSDSFCGTLDECFDGKLGQLSPYQLIDRTSSQKYASLGGAFDEFRSSPIGPVAGGIMGLFLFLSVSVYCYRYYVNGSSSSSPLNSSSEAGRLFDHSRTESVEERRPDYGNSNLSSIEIPPNNAPPAAAILSPYRMNPEYRRPPPGTDSDHGYSTMTPFGDIDSDIAVISAPLRGTGRSPSSRTNSPNDDSSDLFVDESVTVLGANQFIVAATIHMVDTQ